MAKGDILLIAFPFTDLQDSKLRAAVILSETEEDLTVCSITTQNKWQEETDLRLYPGKTNGFKKGISVKDAKVSHDRQKVIKGSVGKIDFKRNFRTKY
ncbi:MAG: hypothetical protein LC100_03005 [Chitinophagales bacterium]|nr:hypothetical protein [Chitinophagales bacterium]